jgi:hypothetical protein
MRALAACVLLAASAPAGADAPPAPAPPDRAAPAATRGAAPAYWPSARCGGCHPRTLDQQLQSHHERAFTNPLFQAQYFELLLPRASREPELAGEARACSACHAPVAFGNARGATRAATPSAASTGRSRATATTCPRRAT